MDININKPPNKNESGVLAALWRKILIENNFMPALGMLVSRYLKDQEAKEGRVKNLRKKNRSTVVNNIAATEMTFKTFLDLIFNLLKVKRCDISIKLTYHNGNTSTHSVSVDSVSSDEQVDDAELSEEGEKL